MPIKWSCRQIYLSPRKTVVPGGQFSFEEAVDALFLHHARVENIGSLRKRKV